VDASGVLAVVIAGLVTGTLGSRRFSAGTGRPRPRRDDDQLHPRERCLPRDGLPAAGLVDDARAETTTGQITGLVLIVVGLLVALRFLALAWPPSTTSSPATSRATRCARGSTSSRRGSTR
jgi:CPA1 family monovalent cation:H+ antiporter